MAHLFSFSSSLFDPSEEPDNPINPIAGYAVLDWLAGKLEGLGCATSRPPIEEDWGWYLDARMGGNSYLIGSCEQSEFENGRAEWMLQVHKKRSLTERLLGRNQLAADDQALVAISRILEEEPEIDDILVDSDA